MPSNASILILSLTLAVSSIAHASELPNGGDMRAGMHQFEAERIASGNFVRLSDGVDAATVVITGQNGLVIDGGSFSTARPHDYTHGIELTRGKNISLYNKSKPMPSPGQPAAAFNLYTAAEIREIFASGNQARIKQAFTSADANHVPPEHLTEAAALAALQAANALADARARTAWQLTAASGNLTVNGGKFNFRSVNQNIIAAETGKLIWDGGNLVSSGGGGDTVLQGTAGIDIVGGSITSSGTVDGKPTAVQYDDRHRLNRDRWTLGKYLAFVTNGDINVGQSGQRTGPVIHLSDGMLKIGTVRGAHSTAATPATRHFNLNSGSVTLRGNERSTLLAFAPGFDMVTMINGGTLNIVTSEKLTRTPTESPSMWNMKIVLERGTINLTNGETIGPDNTMQGGTVNLMGRSSFGSPTGSFAISGGTISVGERSFIGAIRGDSKAQSPYPTSQHDLTITGGTLSFKVSAPRQGHRLAVGTDIGGIYAGDNDKTKTSHPSLTIAPTTVIKLDTSSLQKGEYSAANFVSVDEGDGSLHIEAPIRLGGPNLPYAGTLDTNGLLTFVVR